MKKHIEYKTKGTCARAVVVDVEDGIITDCAFVGGCSGNTQGVAKLAEGMTTDEIIEKLSGIRCGFKGTSCPDQLAKAVAEAIK